MRHKMSLLTSIAEMIGDIKRIPSIKMSKLVKG